MENGAFAGVTRKFGRWGKANGWGRGLADVPHEIRKI